MKTLRQALKELPKDHFAIAHLLNKMEIQGNPISSNSCPLAIYLYHQTKDDTVEVSAEYASTRNTSVKLSKSAQQFIENFDNGMYGYLRLDEEE